MVWWGCPYVADKWQSRALPEGEGTFFFSFSFLFSFPLPFLSFFLSSVLLCVAFLSVFLCIFCSIIIWVSFLFFSVFGSRFFSVAVLFFYLFSVEHTYMCVFFCTSGVHDKDTRSRTHIHIYGERKQKRRVSFMCRKTKTKITCKKRRYYYHAYPSVA